jgi:hypothetical protein
MRHLGSIVLSIILAPLIYVLAGVGEIKLATNGALDAAGRGTNWADVGIGAGAIVVAGALLAVLVMARLSPLGPVIASLLYIAISAWAVLDQSSIVKTLGHSVFGISDAAEAPLTGLALLLAIPLLATIFSPRRWRGRDEIVDAPHVEPNAAPTYTDIADPTYGQPAYPVPTSAAPAYEATPHASAPLQTTPETAADAQPIVEVPTDRATDVPTDHAVETSEEKESNGE